MKRLMVVVLSAGLVLAGCSDDSTPAKTDTGAATPDTGGTATPDTGGTPTPDTGGTAAVTWTSVYDDVIAKNCAPCHTTGSSGGLSMKDKATAFTNLVGKKGSGSCSSRTRVVASKSADSILFQKVDRSNLCGSAMPLGRAKLSAADIAKVKAWIDGGAKND